MFHAVVWLDHHSARIVHFDAEHLRSERIKASSHHTRQHGSSVRSEHEFLADVCEALADTPEILIVGSLVQREAKPNDFAKVARVIYNRLAAPQRLEFDSTVNYPLDRQEVATTDADWAAVVDVNMNGVFRACRAAGRGMVERGRGKIVNIASLLSFQGGITVPAYAAAKGGVAQLTKALANEWAARGVNVNAIAPGYMRTDNTAALQADATRSRQILERIPAGRWGEPSDVVGAAVFLCAPASDYVQGHVLVVDGGWMGR